MIDEEEATRFQNLMEILDCNSMIFLVTREIWEMCERISKTYHSIKTTFWELGIAMVLSQIQPIRLFNH
jgi:hypothetical protein